MPAGRTAEVELEDVPEPAEPAVLPAEPDGVEPAVLPVVPVALGLVVVVMPDADLSLMVLVLTSQHLLALAVEPVPLLCALATPMPAMVATARMAIFFMRRFPDCAGGIAGLRSIRP